MLVPLLVFKVQMTQLMPFPKFSILESWWTYTGACDKIKCCHSTCLRVNLQTMHRYKCSASSCFSLLAHFNEKLCLLLERRRQETLFWLNTSKVNSSIMVNSGNMIRKYPQILLKWSWIRAMLKSATIPRRLSNGWFLQVYLKAEEHTQKLDKGTIQMQRVSTWFIWTK